LTETAPVYLLPVLGLQNIADVSVYATAKITDTEVKVNKPGTYHDGGEDPLVVAGSGLSFKDPGKKMKYDFKLYFTGDPENISGAIEKDNKFYVESSDGLVEIDLTKKYNMDTFGEEIRKLFRQLRAERDPDSTDEYYMTYRRSIPIGNFNVSDISKNPGNYGLKEDEHSYLYLSYSKSSNYNGEGGTLKISNLNVGSLFTGTLPSGKKITEDTPYYLLVENDIVIQHFDIQGDCNRPVVFCYLNKSNNQVKFEIHNDSKAIYYAPYVSTNVQINSKNEFLGSIIGDEIAIGQTKTTLKFDMKEIAKWMEGDDGLKFLPSIGFYDETDPSSGSGGATETVNEISLPDRLRLVLAGNTTDESHYKDAAVVWSDL
jgi:hypothetical protein